MTLAARVTALADTAAIRALPHRYAQAFAALDLDALLALYVPGIALRDHFAAAMRELHTTILLVHGHVVEFTGPDTAVGTVSCHVDVRRRDDDCYQQRVVYTDRYARHKSEWLFAAPRRHELGYGVATGQRPNDQPDARWPASQVGRGTFPYERPSWSAFWGADD